MYMIRHKAHNRFYYYLCVYDAAEFRGLRKVHALGNGQKALEKLELWDEQQSYPSDLIGLGLEIEQLEKWRNKIKGDFKELGLQCFNYKGYNKNRKRPQRQLESFSH